MKDYSSKKIVKLATKSEVKMKPDDVIICINNYGASELKLFGIYTVKEVNPDNQYISLRQIPDETFNEIRFYKPFYKPGDKVVCIHSSIDSLINNNILENGKVYVVIEIDGKPWTTSPSNDIYLEGIHERFSFRRFLPEDVYNKIVKPTAKCPDCNGSGIYTGFITKENCQKCDGKGTI